jgi:hypothetical protein
MPFNRNEVYVARKSFRTTDAVGNSISFERGKEYITDQFGKMTVDSMMVDIDNHIVSNSSWYFARKGIFNPFLEEVSQRKYVLELVRGNDGMDLEVLYETAVDEDFGPLEKSMTSNVMSRVLTDLQESDVEMRKDGEPVKGLKHRKKGCTFHFKKKPRLKVA